MARNSRSGQSFIKVHENCDRSAGSPTETLLRLLLPLRARARRSYPWIHHDPEQILAKTLIGSSDGRCVQRAGTYSASVDDGRLLGVPRSRARISKLYPKSRS